MLVHLFFLDTALDGMFRMGEGATSAGRERGNISWEEGGGGNISWEGEGQHQLGGRGATSAGRRGEGATSAGRERGNISWEEGGGGNYWKSFFNHNSNA